MQNARASFLHDDRSSGYVHELVEKAVPAIKNINGMFLGFEGLLFIDHDAFIRVKDDTYY